MGRLLVFAIAVCLLLACGCAAAVKTTGGVDAPAASNPLAVRSGVQGALDRLIDGYQSKNIQLFMTGVSERYTDDPSNLESEVRQDFSRLHNMSIRYTANNITPDATGSKVYVSLTFTRSAQVIGSGAVENVTGTAEFVFVRESGEYKLYSMKNQRLFGLAQ